MSTIRLKPLAPRCAVTTIVANPGDSNGIWRPTAADVQMDGARQPSVGIGDGNRLTIGAVEFFVPLTPASSA